MNYILLFFLISFNKIINLIILLKEDFSSKKRYLKNKRVFWLLFSSKKSKYSLFFHLIYFNMIILYFLILIQISFARAQILLRIKRCDFCI